MICLHCFVNRELNVERRSDVEEDCPASPVQTDTEDSTLSSNNETNVPNRDNPETWGATQDVREPDIGN